MIRFMRRRYQIVSFLIGLTATNLPAVAQDASQQTPDGLFTDTTVCQLRSSPDKFDHKQIRVNAYLSFGLEEAGMHDPSCLENSSNHDEKPFWVEFANHAEDEGVKGYQPLIENQKLQQFSEVAKQRNGQMLGAVLIGTFYTADAAKAAEDQRPGNVLFVRGFGHMGCCHLFVVSQVESVQTDYSQDLDYSSSWQFASDPPYCYSHQTFGIPTDAEIRSWQQAVNDGTTIWRLDPMKVAEEQLEALRFGRFRNTGQLSWECVIPDDPQQALYFLAPPDDRPTETLLEVDSQPFRKRYEYIARDRKSRLIIVVARPYWLEKLAGSAAMVIWTPVASARVACFAPGEEPKPRRQ